MRRPINKTTPSVLTTGKIPLLSMTTPSPSSPSRLLLILLLLFLTTQVDGEEEAGPNSVLSFVLAAAAVLLLLSEITNWKMNLRVVVVMEVGVLNGKIQHEEDEEEAGVGVGVGVDKMIMKTKHEASNYDQIHAGDHSK